jgi:predicted esterase
MMADRSTRDPHADTPVYSAGVPLDQAAAAMIMIHGRGASAADILSLARELQTSGFALLAPEAAGNTWYPSSFLIPIAQNEPYLSAALDKVRSVLDQIIAAGIPAERTVLAGFSQGACLASEFAARNAQRYGAVLAFSGGLIGPDDTPRDYTGSLDGTPVFLGCSDVDRHIPLARVEETARVLEGLGGEIEMRIYKNMPHTINRDEIEAANAILSTVGTGSD